MKIFQAGADVALQFPLTDENDNPIVPSAVSWRLLDDLENVVVAETPLDPPFEEFIDLVVPGASNTIPQSTTPNVYTGQVTATLLVARTVELIITADDGVTYKRASYGLGARQRLQILVNSFQTLTQAELEATLIPGAVGWHEASDDEKTVAMMEAYRRLTRIGYFVRWPRDPDAQNTISWWNVRNTTIPARFWQFMKLDRYLTYYPEDFRSALRKAQVSEADAILSGDEAMERRESGIVSEQIGQSRVEFRQSKPLSFGVSRRTLSFIDGYVNIRATLTRS